MPSRRRGAIITAIGVAVVSASVLAGCTSPSAVATNDLVGKWVSGTGSTLQLSSDGHARFTDFPRAALRLDAVGAPVSGTASWRTTKAQKDDKLISFTGQELTWSEATGASWTATLTDDSPRLLVFALRDPGLEVSKELPLRRSH